jgi:putative transposase
MRTGRPKAALTISSDERAHLLAITRSRSLPAVLTLRAKIVLACERESSNAVVSTRLGVGPHTIGKRRNRFITDRIEGLYDEMRSGRPRTVEDEAVAELITKTRARKPKACNTLERARYRQRDRDCQEHRPSPVPTLRSEPHRTRSFKLSADPFFVKKLRDVVGLYLNPPDKAVVLCVDEKSQIQALERAQPMLPMGFGYIEGVTHDYQRPGPTPQRADTARSSPNANLAFAIRNSEPCCVISRPTCRPSSTSISSSTTTPPTSIPRSELGSHAVRVGTFTSRPPMPPGSTRSNASSPSSLNAPSVAALSIPPPTSSKKSTTSSAPTMQILAHSCGLRPLTRSSRNSRDFVSEFPGRNTGDRIL